MFNKIEQEIALQVTRRRSWGSGISELRIELRSYAKLNSADSSNELS